MQVTHGRKKKYTRFNFCSFLTGRFLNIFLLHNFVRQGAMKSSRVMPASFRNTSVLCNCSSGSKS